MEPSKMDDMYLNLLKQCLTSNLYDESTWKLFQPRRKKGRGRTAILHLLRMILRPIEAGFLNFLKHHQLYLIKKRELDSSIREEGNYQPFFAYTLIGMKVK